MSRSLYGKLALVLFVLFGAVGVLYTVLTSFTTRMYQQEVNQKLNRALARNIVGDQLLSSQGEVSPYALKELFHLLMIVNPSIEMYLLDVQGTIVNFSAPAEKIKRSAVSLDPIQRFLTTEDTFPILGDDPRDTSRHKVFSVAPIPLKGPQPGAHRMPCIRPGQHLDGLCHDCRRWREIVFPGKPHRRARIVG